MQNTLSPAQRATVVCNYLDIVGTLVCGAAITAASYSSLHLGNVVVQWALVPVILAYLITFGMTKDVYVGNYNHLPASVVALPSALLLLLASCTFAASTGKPRATRWVANSPITGSRISGHEGLFFAIPYVEKVQGVSWRRQIVATVRGETKDGVGAVATVEATFALTDDPGRIKALAREFRDIDKALELRLQWFLEAAFARAVAKIESKDIKPNFFLDVQTAAIDRDRLLNEYALRPHGAVKVTDIHPEFYE